jgi:hypothetical protein
VLRFVADGGGEPAREAAVTRNATVASLCDMAFAHRAVGFQPDTASTL